MDTATAPTSNVPEYTVAEISGAVKRTLEGAFGRVRVRGEITEFKRYPSGHLYFSLKDEGGKISGVVWKGTVPRLGLVPENGVEVIATGKISSYGDRSSYQLVVDRMEYAGAGALLARIEMLRVRLAAEGLFDAATKRALPRLPGVVGVVTSAAGAVLHDICTTVARRFPRPVLVWPVPVQGDGAAARIAAAIAGFDAIAPGGPVARPDVLIVARGGGSLEDLMAFNDEAVVRAAAACRIPLISAVGHETDHTLIDLAADRRAPTPTAAAELAVPSRTELVATVASEGSRLAGGLLRMTQERKLGLGRAERGLPDLPALLATARQRLDDRGQRLALAPPNLLVARRAGVARIATRLPDLPSLLRTARETAMGRTQRLHLSLPNLLGRRRAELAEARLPDPATPLRAWREASRVRGERLDLAVPNLLGHRRAGLAGTRLPPRPAVVAAAGTALRLARAALLHGVSGQLARFRAAGARPRLSPAPLAAAAREMRVHLAGRASLLASVNPTNILSRGYALVLDAGQRPVTAAASVQAGAVLALRFADGTVAVTADGTPPPAPPRRVRRRPGQGDLPL